MSTTSEDGGGPSELKSISASLQAACATSPSTVRNLEHYFDMETKSTKPVIETSTVSTFGAAKSCKADLNELQLPLTKPETTGLVIENYLNTLKQQITDSEEEDSDKRRHSDISDCESDDTVGRRVKERKRIKIDAI